MGFCLMRWQCLAQARQGQEVVALREVPQRSMALKMTSPAEPVGPMRWRWQCLAPFLAVPT